MAIITTFQSPFTFEELVERYETPGHPTNLDFILQGESDFGEWTVDKDCKPGDTVFFRCATTSADHMRRRYTEARRHGDPGLIEYAEKERALYRQYAGKILAIGEIAEPPVQMDSEWEHTHWRSRWYADIADYQLLEAPVAFEDYRDFVKICTTGAITKLDTSQENRLLQLVNAGNPNLQDSKTQTAQKTYEESKDVAERISAEVHRNRKARIECIKQKGSTCVVCGFNSQEQYGVEGIIHAHHLKPLSELEPGETSTVDPITDLEPVCPNCHALIHSKGPREWYTIEEARELVRARNEAEA